MSQKPDIKLACIGAGRMASSILRGLLGKEVYLKSQIGCVCGDDGTGSKLAVDTGIYHLDSVSELLAPGQVVILACKPQQIDEISEEVASLTADSLLISILAGTRLTKLKQKFPNARNWVRCMPNSPGQIGAGVTAFSPSEALTTEDLLQVEGILSALGTFMELPEKDLDAVTAVSGSGPAYVFEFTIALRKAAEEAGLAPHVAETLARETVYGASKLMETSWMKPEELRDSVCSPGGTTEAALQSIATERENLEGLLRKAIIAAKNRSVELSGE